MGCMHGEQCVVLPRLSTAFFRNYYEPEEYEKIPGKMKWSELRRYWRRVYGIILNENPEPCIDVQFGTNWGDTLQYPLSTGYRGFRTPLVDH